MKRNIIALIVCLMASMAFAQEQQSAMSDAARIQLSTYMDKSSPIPANARKILNDKLQKIITQNGMGAMANTRFVMTANIRELNLEKSGTAPVIYIYNLEVNLYIGDGVDGTLFSSCSLEISGAGDTKEKAYLSALKKMKVADPVYQVFIADGKKKIVEYYTNKCDFIITEAQTLAKNQEYDAAIFNLINVPDVCKECYDKCMVAAQAIYQAKIDEEGARLLARARTIWAAGQDVAAAESAGGVLSRINPSSKAYADAVLLTGEMSRRVKELDNREWNFMLKQQQDQVDIEKASIKAVRDVGVAYGQHQQPKTYNIVWW